MVGHRLLGRLKGMYSPPKGHKNPNFDGPFVPMWPKFKSNIPRQNSPLCAPLSNLFPLPFYFPENRSNISWCAILQLDVQRTISFFSSLVFSLAVKGRQTSMYGQRESNNWRQEEERDREGWVSMNVYVLWLLALASCVRSRKSCVRRSFEMLVTCNIVCRVKLLTLHEFSNKEWVSYMGNNIFVITFEQVRGNRWSYISVMSCYLFLLYQYTRKTIDLEISVVRDVGY